jgi:hypothetical protein
LGGSANPGGRFTPSQAGELEFYVDFSSIDLPRWKIPNSQRHQHQWQQLQLSLTTGGCTKVFAVNLQSDGAG